MAGRPRIVMIETGGWGGLGHYAYNLCRALSARGCRVTLVTAAPYELSGLPRAFTVRDVLKPDGPYPANLGRIARSLTQARPHLLHLQSTLSARTDWLALALLRLSGPRSVLTVHNTLPHDEAERNAPGMVASHRLLYALSGHLIVHSEQARAELWRRFRIGRRRISVIPHGNYLFAAESPAPPMAEARRLLGLPEPGRLLLCFGALRPYKGIPDLLSAFTEVCDTQPDVHLAIVGKPIGLQEEDLRSDMGRRGLSGRVTLHAAYVPTDRIATWYAAADIAVLPYRRITQSGALQLAYAFGKPVVATRVGAFPETVEDGRNGLLVAPAAPDGLAAALRRLLQLDASRLAAMGERSRHLAQTRYGWDRIARETIRTYRTART